MTERTLVLVKPDGVQRLLTGRILARFEERGLKLVGSLDAHADRPAGAGPLRQSRHAERLHGLGAGAAQR